MKASRGKTSKHHRQHGLDSDQRQKRWAGMKQHRTAASLRVKRIDLTPNTAHPSFVWYRHRRTTALHPSCSTFSSRHFVLQATVRCHRKRRSVPTTTQECETTQAGATIPVVM
ncbi:unnamed protein product, partial [Ectocarpus sp. 6 AP-2014]